MLLKWKNRKGLRGPYNTSKMGKRIQFQQEQTSLQNSLPGGSYGPRPPWDLSTILPNHHCFRTSSATTLVHCSMHESHWPIYSVPRGANGAIVGQQQEIRMRETTLDPSFPRFIFSPSQCHIAAALSSTQVQGGPLGPLLLTHFSRLTPLRMKSQTWSQITQYKDLN